jgi:hypothetical protein
MTTMIDHVEGHYETQSMSSGQAYVWCPECVVVECDCGETVILTALETVCRCGIDHEVLVRETLTEEVGGVRGKAASLLAERHTLVRYLIVRRQLTGFETPHTFVLYGERVLPVFCVREEAGRFIASRDLGEGWHVRGYYAGELISLLFALHERVAWVSFSPLPGHMLIEDALSHLASRDDFIKSLIVR